MRDNNRVCGGITNNGKTKLFRGHRLSFLLTSEQHFLVTLGLSPNQIASAFDKPTSKL